MMRPLIFFAILLFVQLPGARAARTCEPVFTFQQVVALADIKEAATGAIPELGSFFTLHRYQEAALILAHHGHREIADQLDAWIMNELQTGEIVSARTIHATASWAFEVKLRSGLKAILKLGPDRVRERNSRHLIQPEREVAAYEYDRAIEMRASPVAALRDGIDLSRWVVGNYSDVNGSLQAFVGEAIFIGAEHQYGEVWKAWARRIWIFDYLINNHDRHDQNYIKSFGFIAAIDHGGAFLIEGQERGGFPPPTLAEIQSSLQPADKAIYRALAAVSESQLKKQLSPYLSPRVIHEALLRRRALLEVFKQAFGPLEARARSSSSSGSHRKMSMETGPSKTTINPKAEAKASAKDDRPLEKAPKTEPPRSEPTTVELPQASPLPLYFDPYFWMPWLRYMNGWNKPPE